MVPKYHRRLQKRRAKAANLKEKQLEPDITKKPQVTIVCDPVAKPLPVNIMSKATNCDIFIDAKAATITAAINYVQTHGQEKRCDILLVHTGTSHMRTDSEEDILRHLGRLESNLETHGPKHVAISSIVHRKNISTTIQRKTIRMNSVLREMCNRNKWKFIDNDNLEDNYLSDDIHLNSHGILQMVCNFTQTIQTFHQTFHQTVLQQTL